MLTFFSLALALLLLYLYCSLSTRIQICEQVLNELKKVPVDNGAQNSLSNNEIFSMPLEIPGETTRGVIAKSISPPRLEVPKEAIANVISVEEEPEEQKAPREAFKVPGFIKENWMGVFGSAVLVIGAVFFGLTSELMQHPEARVSVMVLTSFIFLGISHRLKSNADWIIFSGWLQSIAGSVILFATIGAGGIQGLQFIQTPLCALGFLLFGVAINLLLAMSTPSQRVASFHVVLSILAFCIAPQTPILLPVGALVASIGLMAAYRSRWDLHLLLTVVAFAFQNTLWTFLLGRELLPWMHHLAIGSTLVVGLIAACTHYRKKYQSSKWEVLPLVAHIANWGLLTWNIWLHAQFSTGTPLLLGSVAIAGFILARTAKKKEIYWLYNTDTLLSHLVAIGAIVSMSHFSVSLLDVSLMIVFETLVFNFICQLQKEEFLLRAGYGLQYIAYSVMIVYSLKALLETPAADQFSIYLRMGVVAAISWGFYLGGSLKNFIIDDLRFTLLGEKHPSNPLSVMTLFGAFCFAEIYFFGFDSLVIQSLVLSTIGLIALWRKFEESCSWNIVLIFLLSFIHVMSWGQLARLLSQDSIPSILSRVDFLGWVLLDIFLVFGNFLQLNLWKKNIHSLVIYALSVQVALLTFVFTKEASVLIPGLAFLGFSVVALEVGRAAVNLFRYSDEVGMEIKEAMTHIGLLFLIGFFIQYVTVNLQIDPIWHGISLREVTEAMGLLTIIYWIIFYPREEALSKFTQFCGHRLVEGCLGFITLVAVVEMPEVWRPLIWVGMAIGLLIGSLSGRWPKRLSVYSWIYFMASIIHVGFVTSSLTMPSLFEIEKNNIPAFITIAFQLCFAYIAQSLKGDILKQADASDTKNVMKFMPILYTHPSLTVILPVFLGLALLFAFNFEKTILTLLWVGLACAYLALGLLVKLERSIQIAMGALILCSVRLIVFDLIQSDLATRSLVFIGVGCFMLGVSMLYKKYKHRIEVYEGV